MLEILVFRGSYIESMQVFRYTCIVKYRGFQGNLRLSPNTTHKAVLKTDLKVNFCLQKYNVSA